ncbi:MAG: FHA domain-containing protein [Planctomycetota bacterium]
MPKVVITEGPGAGKEYEFDQAAILGRLDSNDIPVKDAKASREHAKLYKQGSAFAIVDLNSSNGTMVNGVSITKRVLKDGDEIGIGLVRMRYELTDAEKPAEPKGGRKSLDAAFSSAKDKSGQPATAASGAGAADLVMKNHQPIQINRVKAGRSLVGFDLEQISSEARMLITLLAIAFFALLVWGSMKFVSG